MSHAPNIPKLKKRASILQTTRNFFAKNNILEVQTPNITSTPSSSPNIYACEVDIGCKNKQYFLQTSPEHPMKILLAHNIGPIYYLGPSFRKYDTSKIHNQEFTMLEWYMPNYSLDDLINQVVNLLEEITATNIKYNIYSYSDIFKENANICPHTTDIKTLKKLAENKCKLYTNTHMHKMDYLNLIFNYCIEPNLPPDLCFITQYPKEDAQLATTSKNKNNIIIADRFEVFWQNIEIANAYQELICPQQFKIRYEQHQKIRSLSNQNKTEFDNNLYQVIHKIPKTAGIAMGFDRIVMLLTKSNNLEDITGFNFNHL